MERYLKLFILLAVTLFLLNSCSGNDIKSESSEITNEEVDNNLSVLTTIFPPYDFTRQIVKDRADVNMLLKPGTESHTYEPTPQDIKKIQDADLFIFTGSENDVWVDGILESLGENKPDILKLMDIVEVVDEEYVEGMEHDHDHEETELDEHVWTSPKNAMIIAQKIADVLSEKDPENSEYYKVNCEEYVRELQVLDENFQEVLAGSKRNTILFGDRFPFRYLADEYGIDYYAAFSGCSVETEASASTVAFLSDKVKELNLPIVFTIEFSEEKIADIISEDTGAKKVMLHSAHNVSSDDFETGKTYLSIMNENVEKLREALN